MSRVLAEVLKPAVRALGPLRIPRKFLIIAVVFLVAAVVPTALMVSSQNASIRTAARERQGIAFFEALFNLTRHVMLHRLALPDPKEANPQERKLLREELEAYVVQDLEQLAKVDQRVGGVLETRVAVRELQDHWRELLNEKDAGRSARAHAGYLAELRVLTAKVEDTSQCIADPQMVTSYLVNIATIKVPDQVSRSLEATLLTLAALGGQALSEQERGTLQGHMGAIQSLRDRVKEMAGPARGFSDPAVAARLGRDLRDYDEATNALLASLGFSPGSQAQDAAAVLFAGKEAVRRCNAFQIATLMALDDLYTARIGALQKAQRQALAASLAAAVLAFYLLAGLYAGFQEGFGEVKATLASLEVGDLTRKARVTSRDEFGDLAGHLNHALEELGRMVDQIQASVQALSAATAAITEGSEDLARRTEGQAASLEETSTATQTLSATVSRTGDQARQAHAGAGRIDQLIEACRGAVDSAAGAIQQLDGASRQVVGVVGVVEDLSFQANLTAVEAVVSAAAGEREKAFAALAAKVHDLGKQGSSATQGIKEALRLTLDLIQSGSADTALASGKVGEITLELSQVTAFIQEMSAAAEEQAAGLHQISCAMNELGGITMRNAAMAEDARKAAEDLARQTRLLKELAAGFKLIQEG